MAFNTQKANKVLDRYLSSFHSTEIKLSDKQLKVKELCESRLYEFVKYAWKAATHEEYKDNWHVEALCDHLQALYQLDIQRLIVNLPPRMGKSNIISVIYPVWCWIKEPTLRFLYNSYGTDISERDSLGCRTFIETFLIQELWGDKFQLLRGNKKLEKFTNTKGGYRIASTILGANTGQGGDIIVIEDPNNIADILSVAVRTRTNRWMDIVMPTRIHNPKTARFLISQQRAHTQDLSGHVLSKNNKDWVHLCLPMEFERAHRCVTVPLISTNGKRWHDPRKKDGDLLFPAHYDAEAVKKLKSDFNNDSYVIAGQLQQRPAPAGGGIIKTDWFKIWKQKDWPEFEYIIQSWDTALTKSDKSCYNACTTWGVFRENEIPQIMLLSVLKDKLEYPDLRKMILRLSTNFEDTIFDDPLYGHNPVNTVLIEAKGSGYSLLQDLSRLNWPPSIGLIPFDPVKHSKVGGASASNKEGRARLVTHLIENGLVWLPTETPKCEFLTEEAEIFINACSLFPNDESNDIIDSMSQAFIRLLSDGQLYNKEDYRPMPKETWNNKEGVYW